MNTVSDVLLFEGDDRSIGQWWRHRVSFMLRQRDLHPERRQRHHPAVQQPRGVH